MGTLYMVATPIGNMEDLSPRALRILTEVDLVAAEDTRRTGLLLHRAGIDRPMVSYHAFNERARRERLLDALEHGDVAVVSDAGTPGISDPGAELVRAAVEAGHEVVPVPGPSAVTAAVSASGIVTGPFTFVGFLPRKQAERQRILEPALESGFPLVLFESPARVHATLAAISETEADREAVLFREITKIHEEAIRGTVADVRDAIAGCTLKGECVIVIGARPDRPMASDPEEVVGRLLAEGKSVADAARAAAAQTGMRRSDLYELALTMKQKRDRG